MFSFFWKYFICKCIDDIVEMLKILINHCPNLSVQVTAVLPHVSVASTGTWALQDKPI